MARVKTNELIGAALDWAVAKCEGVRLEHGLTDDERYSTEWALAGEIIERERIQVTPYGSSWTAVKHDHIFDDGLECFQKGDTYIVAAMRCFVASRFGDEVEIPDELLPRV